MEQDTAQKHCGACGGREPKEMPELLMQRLQHCCDLQSVLDCAFYQVLELTGTVPEIFIECIGKQDI